MTVFVWGTNASETIEGWNNADPDSIYGYGGNDTIHARAGNDYITGGDGADTIWGGEGIDTAMYHDSPVGVFVSLSSERGRYGTAEGDRLHEIENLKGSSHDDTFYGNARDNTFWGENGNDTFIGYGGTDLYFGGAGNDTLYAGAGVDRIQGGEGIDTVSYFASSEGVIVLMQSFHFGGGHAYEDTMHDVENLIGSDHDDHLWGTDRDANELRGGRGNDSLKGYGGADTLYGEIGNDELTGGAGEDTMYGGAGADTFKYGSIADAPMPSWRHRGDHIADFSHAEGDRIDLSAIDANTLAGTNQPFRWIGNDNNYVPEWGAGQLTFKDGYVQGDVDGDMVSDFFIQVNAPARSMVDTDFIL